MSTTVLAPTPEQTKEILRLHALYLAGDPVGQGANLYRANLYRANLSGANLSGADLYGANLSGANLYRANLSGANLSGADLYGADLSGANLSGANLYGADLSGADLYGANLSGADLSGAKVDPLAAARLSIVHEGDMVGWKKCRGDVLVKLLIPAGAARSNATGRKCRAEYATVVEVIGAAAGVSLYDSRTTYRAGELVRCDRWGPDRWAECAGGIHFYLTREEAEAHC
jgi:hypothetical protein